MKRVITTVPLRGRTVTVAEGTTCALHELEGQAKLDALRAGMEIPEGIDICVECLRACKDFILAKRSKRKDETNG